MSAPDRKSKKSDSDKQKALQAGVINYMQYCLKHCKTKEQMHDAVVKLNEHLEKLPVKKRLNTSS